MEGNCGRNVEVMWRVIGRLIKGFGGCVKDDHLKIRKWSIIE